MKKILVIGKPNCGKSLLFNRLTGLKQKVANFPGVTVEVKTGRFRGHELMDFPGIYSLTPITKDEDIAVGKFWAALDEKDVGVILCVLDGTRLERSLLLGLQVLDAARQKQKPIVFAINMLDELKHHRAEVQMEGLQKELQQPMVGISARTSHGIPDLIRTLELALSQPETFIPSSTALQADVDRQKVAKDLNQRFGPKADIILKTQNRFDRFLLSTVGGGLAFFVIMLMMFQAIFTWATPLMDGVEEILGVAGTYFSSWFSNPIAHDFVADAIFGGFGSFLVFVPQIFVLTFLIGVLEDSGYLARAAVICHRPLSLFGLSGKSFVPLLSGHACAIPAIFAARTIESPRHRLLTTMAIPLMSCSARLPVYGLLIAALIPAQTYLGGLVGIQGFAFFCLYILGIVVAMIITGLASKASRIKKESSAPFIIELPPYRWPSLMPLLRRSVSYSWAFITRAGVVIFLVTVIVWVLGYFPNGAGQLDQSWLATMGHWLEPLVRPLGVDWRYAVAILTSFAAREVFVGTLGTMFGIEGADDNIGGIADQVRAAGLTLASGVALLVFYVIALQCAATLAVIRKETGNAKLPIFLFVAYGLLAYVAAILVYSVLTTV